MNAHKSNDELERERAKVSSLKALINAAEEKEADASAECAQWRSKADQLSSTIDRMETELADYQELRTSYERITKELEKLKAAHKELERTQFQQAEEFETSKAAWAQDEANLRAQLSTSSTQLAALQKQTAENDKADSVPSLPASPLNTAVQATETQTRLQDEQTTAALKAELDAVKAQQAETQSSMEQALAAAETLKIQLADLERVNDQLMDDNESYQFLVGERTLMGGFDVKQLLRVDEAESNAASISPIPRRASPTSSVSPSLEGVEEEDEEEEEDADAAIERAVLESHGDGSRTTGAVEAGISKASKPKRISARRNESSGLGLDLAAELAQAEESEVHQSRKVELEARKKTKKLNKDKDQEIKALQDTNKALVLYISKILDRISAHDGFEKVLSSDYTKDGQNSPARHRTRSATTGVTATNEPPNAKGPAATTANPAAKRSSWLQYFTSMRSPPVASSNIKPLRLGTGPSVTPGPSVPSAGLSGGWAGVKEQPEPEEDDEEGRALERKLAEMKLHGTYNPDSRAAETAQPVNGATRANRRASSMYGRSQAVVTVVDSMRRNSGEIVGASKLSLLPSIDSSLVPLTQAGLLKRTEEREKESKINLEKGQASGFTEIEIRGHRMRPSAGRQPTTPNLSLSPVSQSTSSLSPAKPAFSPAITSPGAAPATGGIKGLKMTADLNTNNEPANEGLLARTARRISMMGGSK